MTIETPEEVVRLAIKYLRWQKQNHEQALAYLKSGETERAIDVLESSSQSESAEALERCLGFVKQEES